MSSTTLSPAHPATDVDTVVLGAGIAGASLAWHLASRQRVLLLEREDQPGRHATGRSAAMFIDSYGPPVVRALTRASRAFYTQPPPGFVDQPLLSPRPTLYAAGPGQQALLADTWRSLLPACPALQQLDAAQALALAPCLRADWVQGALLDPTSMDIDVHALHQGYLRGFRRGGGQLVTGADLQTPQRSGQGWRLTLADGRCWMARTVVNATGAWADASAALFGAPPVGLVPRRRSAFTFDGPAGTDCRAWPAVVGIDETWYFKPDAGRLLGSPANADASHAHDVLPEELDIAEGIARIQAATTLHIRRPASTWAGLRSFVADGEPVIGADPSCPGLFWLAGQGGYGIQSADGAARLAAAWLLGQPLPDDLQAQAPGLPLAALLGPARCRAGAAAALSGPGR